VSAVTTIRSIQRSYADEVLNAGFGTLGEEFDAEIRAADDDSLITDAHLLHQFVKDYLVRHAHMPAPSPLILPSRLRPKPRPEFVSQIEELLSAVQSFWNKNYERLRDALRESEYVYSQIGDLNGVATYYAECLIRLGLSYDGICVVDPLSVVAERLESGAIQLDEFSTNPQYVFAVAKNYLQMRYLKPLFTSPTEVPIAIAVPAKRIPWLSSSFNSLENLAEATTCSLFGETFQESYPTKLDWIPFLEKTGIEEFCTQADRHPVIRALVSNLELTHVRDLLGKRVDWNPRIDQTVRALPASVQLFVHLFGLLQGDFLALDWAEVVAQDLGVGLARPRQHWTADIFRQEIQASQSGVRLLESTVQQAAILSEKTDFLLAATVRDLIEWRRDGILEQVRSLFRASEASLQRCKLSDLPRVTQDVVDNIRAEIEDAVGRLRTSNWLRKVKEERRQAGLTVKLFMTGVFGILGNIFDQPMGWYLAAASAVIPTATIWDYLGRHASLRASDGQSHDAPLLCMHELMVRACMEQTTDGEIKPKLTNRD
jgi:hypothetical protein